MVSVYFLWRRVTPWTLTFYLLECVWLIFSIWLTSKLLRRYGACFYKNEGYVELPEEKTPAWAWIAYLVTFLGPVFLNASEMMPTRWALTVCLCSFGWFILYIGKKDKEFVFALFTSPWLFGLALAIGLGVPIPFSGPFALALTLIIGIIIVLVLGMIGSHLFNRVILRKIREARPLGTIEQNSTDQ